MNKTIYDSALDFLNNCCNHLFQIKQKFDRLKSFLEADYKAGLVTLEEYNRLKKVCIDEFVDSKYTLDKDDVLFVKEYAWINSHGEIMARLIKPKYLKKVEDLKKIFESVRKFAFYGSFSLEDRKNLFKNEVIEADLKKAKKDGNNDLEKKLLIIDSCNAEQLNFAIANFYGIDYSFYEWFKLMALREEFINGFVFNEHNTTMIDLSKKQIELQRILEERVETEQDLMQEVNLLKGFTEEALEYQSNLISKNPLLNIWGRKNSLYETFRDLFKLSGVVKYLSSINTEDILHVDSSFKMYIDKYYNGVSKGIDVSSFVKTLFSRILNYYTDKINKLKSKLETLDLEIGKIQSYLEVCSKRGLDEAQLEKDIFDNLENLDDLTLLDFSEDERQRIYADLKEEICRDINILSENEILKKGL